MSDNLVLASLARLEGGQTSMQATLTSVQAGLTGVQRGLTSVQTGLTDVQTGLTALENRQTALEDSQTKLRVDVMARMDRLENRLTEIRDDIGVNMGSTRRAHEAADNTRSEVRLLGEQVNVMWRQMKRLEQQVRDITGDP
jgi:chromosome segregation ATPase